MERAYRSFRYLRPSQRRARRLPPPEDPSKCTKYFLFTMNVLFWLISVVVLMIGVYVMVELKDVINSLSDIWTQPAIIMVAFGALLFIITFVGCIGSLRENTCMLCFFSVCLAVILLLMLTAGVLGYLYREPLKEAIHKKLSDAIVFYRDEQKQDLQFLIDTAQTEIECCGSRSYEDWQLNSYFNCSSQALERCGVPFSCCKKEIQLNRQCGYAEEETKRPRQDNIYREGCLTKSIAWIQNNLYIITGLAGALLLLIIVSTCMALSLRSQVQAIHEYDKNNSIKRGTFNSRPAH
ncbi:Tetraspanin-33 [Exaiptasia diaphana]|nr:Tetraspanin-33 [Exaiptasia diaphana]